MKIRAKMIGMDLDGTLLTTQKTLLPYTRKILRRAIDQGMIVLPVTGRPFSGLPEEIVHFPGMRYAVTANGGRILDIGQKKVLYEKLLPADTAFEILKIFEQYDTLREIYYDGIGFAQEDALHNISHYIESPPMAEYIVTTRKPVSDVHAKFVETNRPVDKIQALFATQEDKYAALEELQKIPDLEITGALEKNIEINPKGVHKGKAMITLGEFLGISREEMMAFGDGSNDTRMLREVGIGVAMENGTDEVKAAADYITMSNDEEGVARFIEKYVLD